MWINNVRAILSKCQFLRLATPFCYEVKEQEDLYTIPW